MAVHTEPGFAFIDGALAIVQRIRDTQMENLGRAAQICADSIAAGGLVHLFGTGHSRIPVEEMFPRHGSFPGFHPIVELSLTNHTQVVGANGQRQAMYLERIEGFGEIILRNFVFGKHDSFMVFSNGGVNGVVMDVALGAKQRGMPVIGVVSVDHCQASGAKHSSGKTLIDIADVILDNGSAIGDAFVQIENLPYPVAPGSTVGYAVLVDALKAMIADELTRRGQPPLVLTSSALIGSKESAELFEKAYDDYRARVAQVYDTSRK
jgi:uncharacterized phosphosugar-binding protein